MKHLKRSLALLLVLALLAGTLPAVSAAEPDAAIRANAEKDLRYLALDDENNGPHDLYYQQKIMNPVTEDAFVLWYSGKNTGYPIAWTSSDPELIAINDFTHMAERRRVPDEDRQVTLTAAMSVPYASGSSETYPLTKELTVLVPGPATMLQMDYDALTITNPDDVRENLPLLRKGKYGASISWTSSDPAVISDDSPESALYDGGVVTRPAYGAAPAAVTLTAELTAAGKTLTKTFELRVSPKPAPADPRDHYLFVCYAENYDWNGDRLTTEEIYFGLSEDGMQWRNINVYTLNGREYTRPILRSTVGDMGTRDPHIVRSPDGDKFYVLATDLHAVGNPVPGREDAEFKRSSFDCVNGNRDLVIWETSDLTDWGEPRLVKCNFPSAGNTYAPEAVWDEGRQAYLVYWASKDNAELNPDGSYKPEKVGKIYYCYTRDFNTFSEPTLWLASTDDAMKRAFPSVSGEYDVYDTTIRYDPYDGLYYRFGTKNRLYVQTSEHLDGPWSDAVALPGSINNGNIEAPTTYQLPDGSWMLLGDNYRQYVPYQAAHLADFVSGNYQARSFEYAANGPRYKHGTILPISEREYLALLTAYDETLPAREAPAEGEGVAVDHRDKTLTVAEDYEVRADSPTGPPVTGGSLEPWIGRTLYVRRPAAEGLRASAWTALEVRPCEHDYQPDVTAPTCTAGGFTTYTCTLCGERYTGDETAALGHAFGAWTTAREATCTAAGEQTRACARCGETETRTLAALGHDYRAAVTDPTCTAGGFTIHTCARCGDSYTDGETAALGHAFGDWTTAREATCTAAGEQTRACARCGETETRPIEKLGHDYKDGTCTRCGEKDPDYKPPTTFLFSDVKDAGRFYYAPVYWAYYHDPQITKGVSDTLFSPDSGCTRAQVVTFLWRAMGRPEPTHYDNPFKDMKTGSFYYKAVLWAVESGITMGTTDSTFRPDQTCTRGQIVTFLYRTQNPAPKITKNENPFKDVKQGAYSYIPVLWAVENDITKGKTEDAFRPDEICTRGEIVTFLYRALAGKK